MSRLGCAGVVAQLVIDIPFLPIKYTSNCSFSLLCLCLSLLLCVYHKTLTSIYFRTIPVKASMCGKSGRMRKQRVRWLNSWKRMWVSLISRCSNLKFGDKKIQIHFRYERLVSCCFYCGYLGHLEKNCDKRAKDIINGCLEEGKYGDWLKAQDIFYPSAPSTSFSNNSARETSQPTHHSPDSRTQDIDNNTPLSQPNSNSKALNPLQKSALVPSDISANDSETQQIITQPSKPNKPLPISIPQDMDTEIPLDNPKNNHPNENQIPTSDIHMEAQFIKPEKAKPTQPQVIPNTNQQSIIFPILQTKPDSPLNPPIPNTPVIPYQPELLTSTHKSVWKRKPFSGVRIWDHPWVPNMPRLNQQTKTSAPPNIKLVKDLLEESGRRWNRELVMTYFPPQEAKAILNITGMDPHQKDRMT
ncbi:gag-pol polyprotein, partial [Striga asiatica]